MSLENTHNSTRSSYIHFVQNKRLNHAFYHLISFIKFNLPGCFFIMENRFLSFRHLFLLPARGWNFFDSQAILKIRNKKAILIVTEPQGWSYRAPIICRPGARKRVVWKWGPLLCVLSGWHPGYKLLEFCNEYIYCVCFIGT